jgi:hypothetical protein
MKKDMIKYDLNIPGKKIIYRELETNSLPRVGEEYTLTDFLSNGTRGAEIKNFIVMGIERIVLVDTKIGKKSKVTGETITVTIEPPQRLLQRL